MTKKLFLGVSFSLMVFVLAGCVSIPIGDSVLEISTDGVEFIPAVGSDENTNENDDFFSNLNDENNNNDDMNNNNNDDTNNNSDASGNLDTDLMGQGGPGIGQCNQDFDHSQFTKHFDYDFYIPACAELVNVKTYAESLNGYFLIANGDWEAVHQAYEEAFAGDEIYENNSDFQSQYVEMRIKLADEDYARVYITQNDEGDVELELRYDYPAND